MSRKSGSVIIPGEGGQCLNHFRQSLRRDGYQVDQQTGEITPVGPQLSIESIARLADPSAIREGFERFRRAISDDPALAVGSAKELIESTHLPWQCGRVNAVRGGRDGSPGRTRRRRRRQAA